VKKQSDFPVGVWVYYDQGWPERKDKKWKWVFPTGKVEYN
jgi:hypothetical protein